MEGSKIDGSKERISFEFENKDDGGGVDVFRQAVGGSDLRALVAERNKEGY